MLGAGDRSQPKGLEKKSERLISSLAEISWGDFLVHQDFGVGVYRGLSLVGEEGCREENIKIEFADGGLVYVPLGRFDRVHKYLSVGGVAPKISKLGTGAWEKQKRLAKKSIDGVVDHLVSIHAARSSPRGFSYVKESDLFQQLEESFPFEETLDQKKASRQIPIKDINNWEVIIEGMKQTVYGKLGTAKRLNNKLKYTLAGKTGTAQVFGLDPEEEYIAENIDEKLRDHALFTGFAPIEDPQVAIAIIVENAGSGSSKAAPLARSLLDEYFSKNPVVKATVE